MKETSLVIGGCKSGKRRRAIDLAERYGLRKIFPDRVKGMIPEYKGP